MWPFSRMDLNRIDIQLQFWEGETGTPYTARLSVGGLEVVEALGVVQGADFRLTNITTVARYRRKGFGTTVVGTLLAAGAGADSVTCPVTSCTQSVVGVARAMLTGTCPCTEVGTSSDILAPSKVIHEAIRETLRRS